MFSFRIKLVAKTALVGLLTVAASLDVPSTSAMANGVNTAVTSTGYLYIQNSANNGIDRYNIATGEAEAINMTDPTCQSLDRDEIYDTAADPSHFKLYWSNFQSGNYPNYRSQINVLDLKTGVCEGLVNATYVYVSGGEYYSFAGIALDETNNRLYYVDEGGARTTEPGDWQNKNRSLRYLDLNASAGTRDHIIELTNQQYSYTVGFARDVDIDGDYAYIGGKNFDSPNNKNSGDGIFKARVTTDNVVATTAEVSVLVTYEENDTDINQVDVRGTNLFYTANGMYDGWNKGVYRANTTDTYQSGAQILAPSNGAADPTGTRKYNGIALGQGDELFTMDFRSGWGDMAFYVSQEGATPTQLTGTYNSGNTYWGTFSYSAGLVPRAPSIGTVDRTADTTATINFSAPAGADPDGNYAWTAKPVGGGSDLTGTCTASPCNVTGLAQGVHYNFSMLHNFRNSAGQTIIHSGLSAEVVDTVAVITSAQQAFGGFPTMRSALSKAQKTAIRNWLNANPTKTTATCIGQVGYNWANVSKAELRFLAKNRAKNVCNYIHAVRPSISTSISTSVISQSKRSTIRLVNVTLR